MSTSTSKPRQSLKRKSSAAAAPTPTPTTALEQAETLLPGSCTPGYVPPQSGLGLLGDKDQAEEAGGGRRRRSTKLDTEIVGGGEKLNDEEKAALLVEILGFQPTELLQDITESARQQVDKTVLTIENWLSKVVRLSAAAAAGAGGDRAKGKAGKAGGEGGEEEMMLEVDQGLHGLETLLNDHMDTALDKLTSWALRNTFEIPEELRLTLPWHQGLDFDRGAYVAGLPEGEIAVQRNIEELREQVENMRKLNHGLTMADRTVGEKVKALQRQKDAIGFITTLAGKEAGLTSLPNTARTITSHMDTLYNTLSREFETVVPLPSHPPAAAARMTNQLDPFSSSSAGAVAAAGSAGAGSGNTGAGSGGGAAFTREWEFGRAAYLSWAVSRARALVVVDSYDRGKNQHGSEGRGGGGGMDVDQEDGPGMITANTNTTSIKGTGTAGVGTDGEQKRLETLLAMTRGVSGGGAATSVGGTTTTTATGPADGVKGMGWALHGLSTKSDSSSAGVGAGGVGGGGAGAGGARGGGSSGA